MKYKGGKSWYDHNADEWKYEPRIYTDFYCSISEWDSLGRGKDNFMYQVRSAIVDILGYPEDERTELEKLKVGRDECKIKLKNGLIVNKLSFDRHGRRDSLEGEKYSAWIVKNAIKLITRRDAEVEFFSWKGTVDHIEISFPDCNMPNIIVLIDEYTGSTNKELIACIDSVYKTLKDKTHRYYESSLQRYYNSDWDRIFYCSTEDNMQNYIQWSGAWLWKDVFKKKSDREYDGIEITWKN